MTRVKIQRPNLFRCCFDLGVSLHPIVSVLLFLFDIVIMVGFVWSKRELKGFEQVVLVVGIFAYAAYFIAKFLSFIYLVFYKLKKADYYYVDYRIKPDKAIIVIDWSLSFFNLLSVITGIVMFRLIYGEFVWYAYSSFLGILSLIVFILVVVIAAVISFLTILFILEVLKVTINGVKEVIRKHFYPVAGE